MTLSREERLQRVNEELARLREDLSGLPYNPPHLRRAKGEVEWERLAQQVEEVRSWPDVKKITLKDGIVKITFKNYRLCLGDGWGVRMQHPILNPFGHKYRTFRRFKVRLNFNESFLPQTKKSVWVLRPLPLWRLRWHGYYIWKKPYPAISPSAAGSRHFARAFNDNELIGVLHLLKVLWSAD